VAKLTQQYPLLSAVARASLDVARHRPAVVRIEYTVSDCLALTLHFALASFFPRLRSLCFDRVQNSDSPCADIYVLFQGSGPIERTLLFAGKGVTYDSGGVDVKTDGHMQGAPLSLFLCYGGQFAFFRFLLLYRVVYPLLPHCIY
jgi:leucyl aminopeptidase